MANLATYALSTAAVTTRSGEVTAADWSGGMNRGGANACGIGIASDLIDPSTNDWTTSDQHGNARSPQLTQHIGITGLGAGSNSPLTGHGIMVINGADVNDTMALLVATAAAANGAVFHAASGAINIGVDAVAIGDVVWGAIPVA